MLDFQHLNVEENRYNFVVAYNSKENIFDAILGFIPLDQFDKDLKHTKNIWLAIWKKTDRCRVDNTLGLDLLSFLEDQLHPNAIAAIGINTNVQKIYKMLKYETGTLKQFYYANPKHKNQLIIEKPINSAPSKVNSSCQLRLMQRINNIEHLFTCINPQKSPAYFYNRYLKHPFYKYEIYEVWQEQHIVAAFVIRKVYVQSSNALRIVDYAGDLSKIGNITDQLLKLLEKENSEYVDFICSKCDEVAVRNLGLIETSNDTIVPNYFEPFLKQNIPILYAYKGVYRDYHMVKGDSDQDRPNQI